MTITEPAGPRLDAAEASIIIPDYREAELLVFKGLGRINRIAAAVAQERDAAVREREEALQEAGRLRARVEELEGATDDGIAYLLWSGRHGAWWAPDERGYTEDVERAGRYGRADAMRLAARSALCGVLDQVTCMVAAPENWPAA